MPHYEPTELQKLIDSLKAAKNRPQEQGQKGENSDTGKGKPEEKQKAPPVPPTLPLYKPSEK